MPLPDEPLPKYVVRQKAKGGKYTYLYFRWKGVYRKIPSDPHSQEFRDEYARLLAATGAETETPIIAGSVRAMIRDYKQSPEYKLIAPKSQADYARALDHLRPIGDFQADNVRRQHIIRLRNKMGAPPRTMDAFVAAVSRCFAIGMDLGYTDRNPAARIERLNDAESYLPWPKQVRTDFEAASLPEWVRTAYMIGLYTGQRESDVLRLARTRYDGAGFDVRQGRPEAKRGKGRKGAVVQIYVPAVKVLREYLANLTHKGLLFVARETGRSVKDYDLQGEIRKQLDALGHTEYSFHGLRHTTGTALAEVWATDREIMAILGHLTPQMVTKYTKRANQRKLATSAIKKLEDSGGL